MIRGRWAVLLVLVMLAGAACQCREHEARSPHGTADPGDFVSVV